MAIWNTIRRGNLKEGLNILAEHYQQERIIAEEKLKSISSKRINQLFSEQTNTIKAHHLSTDWRVFDLPDSLNNFLLGGKDPSIEKVTSNKKVASQDDFIISRLRYYLKETAIVPTSEKKIALSTEYLVYRSKRNLSTHLLLPFALSSYVQAILKWAQTGNAHPRFSSSTFASIYLPDIIINSSNHFKGLISKANEKIIKSDDLYSQAIKLLEQKLGFENENLDSKNRYLTNLSSCVNQKLIDPKFFQPKYIQIIKQLNSNFKLIELKKLARIEYGYMPMQDYEDDPQKGIPLIRVTNITNNLEIKIDDLKYVPNWVKVPGSKFVEKGDILMVQCGDTTGKVGYIYEEIENYLFPSFCFSVKVFSSEIDSLFLAALLKTDIMQTLFDQTVMINTVRPNTTKPRFEKMYIPILSPDFQNEVTALLLKSYELKKESKRLLAQAKTEVESLIENSLLSTK